MSLRTFFSGTSAAPVDDTFHLGLTMAGAVSAGAYSAGVFDFLMEALDAWEAEKKRLRDVGTPENQWPIPCHKVVIPVMSGASAGGITGALGLLALADPPQTVQKPYPQVGTVVTHLPRLYEAWVEMPRFVDPAGGPDFLGTNDLKEPREKEDQDPPKELVSLLDTTILFRIVKKCFANLPKVPNSRVYLSDTLHLFLTHTNLRGVPYEIGFAGGAAGEPGYGMIVHADRRHFTLASIGSAKTASIWADPDPAQAADLADPPDLTRDIWQDYIFAALGTGAFPVGLRARIIRRVTLDDYKKRQMAFASMKGDKQGNQMLFRLPVKFPDSVRSNVDYVTTDGGVLNNEPFELARWTLMTDPPNGNPREVKDSDHAVIMIDPFPETPDFDATLSLNTSLAAVLKRLIPVLRDQARFKPDDLIAALDETIFSRFLVAPRRKKAEGEPLERFGIACGLLGGFGGFLSEEFRAHDYQLGRFNAYHFLRESFSAPLDNKILKNGYAAASARLDVFKATPVDGNDYYQVIPLVGTAAQMPQPPQWPRVTQGDVDTLVKRARGRANAVFDALIKQTMPSRIVRGLVRIVWSIWGSSEVDDLVRWALMKDLLMRDQIDGPTKGAGEKDRQVIAALADPAFDFRTIMGIAAESGLSEAAVTAILNTYKKTYVDFIYERGPLKSGGPQLYTLDARKPGLLRRIPIVKNVAAWFGGDPVIG